MSTLDAVTGVNQVAGTWKARQMLAVLARSGLPFSARPVVGPYDGPEDLFFISSTDYTHPVGIPNVGSVQSVKPT